MFWLVGLARLPFSHFLLFILRFSARSFNYYVSFVLGPARSSRCLSCFPSFVFVTVVTVAEGLCS